MTMLLRSSFWWDTIWRKLNDCWLSLLKKSWSDERIEIFLAKENDVQSEQTFQISFQVFDSVPPNSGFTPAEIGVDYNLPLRELTFNPDMQRLPLAIELLADRIPEETEAFQISSTPQGDPAYSAPSSPLFQHLS